MHFWKRASLRISKVFSGTTSPVLRIRRKVTTILRHRWSRRLAAAVRLNVYDFPREMVLRVETADLDPKTIQVRLKGRMLTLAAEPAPKDSPAITFRKSIFLPRGLRTTEGSAKYRGHELVICIPKETSEDHLSEAG